MKRRITSLLIVAVMVLTMMAGTVTVGAADPVITMLEGAAIRCAEPSGIRFISQISTENVEAATEIGTYIFPYAEYVASGAATPQAYFATNGAKFVKVVADKGIHNKGEQTYIYAALVNIKPENYGRAYAAVSYAVINGNTEYSAFDGAKNARSIRQVAVAAYNDFSTVEGETDGIYTYKYQIAEGKWSCYSETQREVIASYDNAIFRLMTDANGNVWNGANDKYNDPVLPALNAQEKHSSADKVVSINPLPTITDGALDFTYDGYCGYYRTRFDNHTTTGELTDLAKDLRDGFSLEVYFFVEARAATKGNWRGIVDMVHAGGFGINIQGDTTGNTKDTIQMRMECGSGTGYVEHKQAIEVEQWHHMVLSYTGYDAENAGGEFTLYIDGVLVATMDAKGELRLPDFRKADTSYDFLCIGGCFTVAKGYDTWEGVTDCKVKTCNIFSDAVTAAEVAAMYATAQN